MLNQYNESDSKVLRDIFRKRLKDNLRRLRSIKNRDYKAGQNDTLSVVSNQGCSLGCKSCARTNKTDEQVMDIRLLHHVMSYASRHFHSISITGGEPTDCIEMIVDTAKQHPDLRVNVTTHGENMDLNLLDYISSSPNIYPLISLNGIGDIHDSSRHPGSFSNVIQSISKLRKRQIPFGIISVVNKTNLAQLLSNELVEFVDLIGACTLELFQYYPIGLSEKCYEMLQLSSLDMDRSIAYRNRLFQSNPYHFLFKAKQSNTERCARELQIFVDGAVSYCPFSVWAGGIITVADTDEVIRKKLNRDLTEWNKLTAHSHSYCPLQSNTKEYINFFSKWGSEQSEPTGILDQNSNVHESYCRMAAMSETLTPSSF